MIYITRHPNLLLLSSKKFGSTAFSILSQEPKEVQVVRFPVTSLPKNVRHGIESMFGVSKQ